MISSHTGKIRRTGSAGSNSCRLTTQRSDLRFGHHRYVGYAHLTPTRSLALVGDPTPMLTNSYSPFRRLKRTAVSGTSPLKSGHGKQLHRKRFVVAHN